MVGGTIRRKLIHRMSFRASVLQLTLATTRCQNHCRGELRLDNAFVLIDGTRSKCVWNRPFQCDQQEGYAVPA